LKFGVWNSENRVENAIIGVKDVETEVGNAGGGVMKSKIGVKNRETGEKRIV
jgi:hypothetical protein